MLVKLPVLLAKHPFLAAPLSAGPLAAMNVDQTTWLWIGLLVAVAVGIAIGLTWAAGQNRMGVIRLLIVALTLFSLLAILNLVGNPSLWLSILFLTIVIPVTMLVAAGVVLVAGYVRFRMETRAKIEPYLGPVAQQPVDVVQDRVPPRLIPRETPESE